MRSDCGTICGTNRPTEQSNSQHSQRAKFEENHVFRFLMLKTTLGLVSLSLVRHRLLIIVD